MTELVRHRVRTRRADEAERTLRELYGHVELAGDDFGYAEDMVAEPRFALGSVVFDGTFQCVAESRAITVTCAPAAGYAWESGRESGELSRAPALFQPGTRLTARVDHVHARTLVLDPVELERLARVTYADDRLRLRFDDPHPVSDETARLWLRTYDAAASLSASFDSASLRAEALRLLSVATLEAFRLTGDRVRRHETVAALRTAYHRATGFLDDHASLPVTPADAAEAAGVSVRDLERAFAAHGVEGVTPGRYLRRTRLAAAHMDLVDADPTRGPGVTDIALRWGFPHVGRFARHYRDAYGVDPAVTLHR